MEEISASLEHFKEYVASQTLSVDVSLRPLSEAGEDAAEVEWNEDAIKIRITRI